MEVNNRSLIKIGHFLLTKEYCARDWIDTLEVVETKVILNKIVNAIVKHINNSGYDDYIIAGVDLVGTLLASRIAFTLQAPLTYIVPEKEKNVNAHQEIDLEIEKDKKVILITDAIVTFNTVKSAIEKTSWKIRLYVFIRCFIENQIIKDVQNMLIRLLVLIMLLE